MVQSEAARNLKLYGLIFTDILMRSWRQSGINDCDNLLCWK
jgi:hypothetical protein